MARLLGLMAVLALPYLQLWFVRDRLLQHGVRTASRNMVALTVDLGANLELPYDSFELRPIHLAMERRDLAMVTYLISRGADINGANRSGWTAL